MNFCQYTAKPFTFGLLLKKAGLHCDPACLYFNSRGPGEAIGLGAIATIGAQL